MLKNYWISVNLFILESQKRFTLLSSLFRFVLLPKCDLQFVKNKNILYYGKWFYLMF